MCLLVDGVAFGAFSATLTEAPTRRVVDVALGCVEDVSRKEERSEIMKAQVVSPLVQSLSPSLPQS